MQHIVESQQFDRQAIELLFRETDAMMKHPPGDTLKGKILASLFYEPSTRTRFSFESAMLRLGGNMLSTENAREFSSAAKGETLEDTIRVIGNYADVIVLRHYEEGSSARAAAVSSVPIINAGDGAGQHPTQALLDLFTIWKELGSIDGIHLVLSGDLKHGRTIRSLAYLCGKFDTIRITFVSSPTLRVGDDIREYLLQHNVHHEEVESFENVIETADAVYQTRIQKERFASLEEFERSRNHIRINRELAERMKKGSIIMHPLPRVDEIAPDVDTLPQAVYFKQAGYGLYVRMALLKRVLG